jgi:hypothetical protein
MNLPNTSDGVSGTVVPLRSEGMRKFKYDKGDWIAVRNHRGEWVLGGKVVDADSESITVDRRGLRTAYLPGEDPIAHIRWTGNGKWALR